ncbi:MAG TPA: hypothetical protein ENG78_05605 [Acidiferrobacteraceae bacterium]|nr:hypothetical protein [Acidiferrobacteraceae bacterium]HEX20277.1 hypothetical protein [Acidiferrobacteraceae bacterium]
MGITLFLLVFTVLGPNIATSKGFSDPMRPSYLYGGETKRKGLVLESTFISDQRKSAIISGRLLHIGDRIGKAKVVEIVRNEVVLLKGKKTIRLRVAPKLEKNYKNIDTDGKNGKK